MQIVNYKIIFILILSILIVQNLYAKGKRKNFLSHGPSVSAFSQGETALNNINDPAIIYHNSSLLSFFNYNTVSLSRYNLFDGTSYNAVSASLNIFDNITSGFSIINLSSGDVELRKDPFDKPKTVSTNQWAYIFALSSLIRPIDVAVGLDMKYIIMDLYEKKDSGVSFDVSFSKFIHNIDIKYTQIDVGLGVSAQNIIGTGVKLDKFKEDFQKILKISSLIIVPTKFHFDSRDTISVSVDLKNEDTYNELFTGVEYKFVDKYSIRCGYYPDHITAGLGMDVSSFTINYSADFNEIDLINRFSLTYKWNKKQKTDNILSIEAKSALKEDRISQIQAEEIFNKAKSFYSKRQYLYATELLQKIIVDYPNYESPMFYYKKIQKNMKDNSVSTLVSDFDIYSYSAGYINYYAGNYSQCSKEWMKYLQFDNKNKEITEYYQKVQKILNNSIIEEKRKEFDIQATQLLQDGIDKFNAKKWISSINQMENLQIFVRSSKYTTSFNYYSVAKDYIDKSVKELSLSIKKENTNKNFVQGIEKFEIDEKMADEKYKEGLILYAKGKYFEAERMWELTLRLNPNHTRAINALEHIKK
ncbi:MAG: hypothetical protein PHH62_06760 [Endomicrobiaceae bacterium]|nr:hypothetical protein [Endomicrobiaceae bacterium]